MAMATTTTVPSDVQARNHHLMWCPTCDESIPNQKSAPIETLAASMLSMYSLEPYTIIRLHCNCKQSNQPFYICTRCVMRSTISRTSRNPADKWLKDHLISPTHCGLLLPSSSSPAHAASSSNPSATHHEADSAPEDGDFSDFVHTPDSPYGGSSTTGLLVENQQLQQVETSASTISTTHISSAIIAHPVCGQSTNDFSEFQLMNQCQRIFFKHEQESPGLGFAYIVKKAFGVTAPASSLSCEEIAFHLNSCSLCVDLTRSQLRAMGNCIEQIVLYYTSVNSNRTPVFSNFIEIAQKRLRSRDDEPCLSPAQISILQESYDSMLLQPITSGGHSVHRGLFKATKPPTTYLSFERYYLKSANAMYRNLPIPDVHLSEDKSHAYIRVPQIVTSFLASGIDDLSVPSALEFSDENVVSSYYTSEVAREVYKNTSRIALMKGLKHGECFSLHFKDWADDAQKNQTRTNSTSYNIRTVTFMKHKSNGDIRYYSYVISISLKGKDHEEVERIFKEDLELLSQPNLFYSGYHKQKFWAIVSLVAGVRDRPARGETFHVGNHGHLFGKRFRYATFHHEEVPLLPCSTCHSSRIARLKTVPYAPKTFCCNVCADLDYESPLLEVEANWIKQKSSTHDYPTILVPGSPVPPTVRPVTADGTGRIGAVKVSFQLLMEVACVGFYNYHYLQYMKVQRKRSRNVRERDGVGAAVGWTVVQFKTYLKSAGANEYICIKIRDFSSANDSVHPDFLLDDLKSKILPSTWQRLGCSLTHQVDAVFHLVFHGISMDVWDIFLKTTASISIGGNTFLKSRFGLYVNPILEAIHELQLTDLPVIPFAQGNDGKGFSYGGWIGSHKLSFCMLMPYIVSHVRYFYRAATKCKDLPVNSEEKIQHIQMALFSFFCSNVILLQRSITKQQALLVGEYTKVFIRELTETQKKNGVKTAKLAYLQTGNLLSCLNLEENVRMYGPLRFFWDALDEKNVQKVKRAWPHVNMSHPTWLSSLLENVTREQHLHLLWDRTRVQDQNTEDGEESSWDTNTSGEQRTKPRHQQLLDNIRVMTEEQLQARVACRKPFSAVFHPPQDTEPSMFRVILRQGGARSGKLFSRPLILGQKARIIGSCFYYRFQVSIDDGHKKEYDDDPTLSSLFHHVPVLVLPFQFVEEDKEKKPIATIISLEDHTVYQNLKLVLPSLLEGQVEQNPDMDLPVASIENGMVSL